MAKEASLREYQRNLLDRLDEVKDTQAQSAMGFLGVAIGDKNVLIGLNEVAETVPLAEIQKVPLVKPWFLGVSNVRGVLYAVNDLLYMMTGVFTSITSNTRIMIINHSISPNVSFIADRLIGLRSLALMKKREQQSEAGVYFKLETYEGADGYVWHVLDCLALLSSKELAAPLAT